MRCPFCGCPTENAGGEIDADIIAPSLKSADNRGIAGIVLGSIGIVFAWLLALICWICGGTGLFLSLIGRNQNAMSKKCHIGIILSTIALVCSLISSIIGIILMT